MECFFFLSCQETRALQSPNGKFFKQKKGNGQTCRNCLILRLSSGCRRRIAAHHSAASGRHADVSEDQNHFRFRSRFGRRGPPRIFVIPPPSPSSVSSRESMSSLSMSLLPSSSHGRSRNVAASRSGQQMFGAPSPMHCQMFAQHTHSL